MNETHKDREDFSFERQDRSGGAPDNESPSNEPQTKSATVDQDALPEHIRRKYYVLANEPREDRARGEMRLYADGRGEYLAFKATQDRLVTRLAAAEVIRDMVSVAQHRQWDAFQVRGSLEFRREAWLEAGSRGMEVQGYEPPALDRQALSDRQEVWNRRHPRTYEPEVRSVADKDAPTARLDYDKGISGRLIELGRAPYGNDKTAEASTYVAIELENGQRHIVWGVGLENAVAESKAWPGDQIHLRREGVERVLKAIKVIDAASGSARIERRHVPRNRWRVTAEIFRTTDRGSAARNPDLLAAQSQMVIIEKAVERVFPENEQVRRSITEAAKERIAQHLERGHSFPRATVLARTQERHPRGLEKHEGRHERRPRLKEQER